MPKLKLSSVVTLLKLTGMKLEKWNYPEGLKDIFGILCINTHTYAASKKHWAWGIE